MESADAATMPVKEKQKPVRFISKMKHHVINRPQAFRSVISQRQMNGTPLFMAYTPPTIEFLNGVFTTEDAEQIEFLRQRGDGRRYGMNIDYWEVPYRERQAQIDQAAAKKPVTHEEMMARLEELEAKLAIQESGDGAGELPELDESALLKDVVDQAAGQPAADQPEAAAEPAATKAPAKKTTKKKLADTL